MTMSHQLTDKYWESLGPNGPFLCELFHNQSQQLTQLQTTNNALHDQTLEAQSNIMDAAAKVTSAITQAILTNMPTGSHSSRGIKVANPECFNGSRDKAEQFVRSIRIAITMQLNMFVDERMKILYALSFMCGAIAQVWAENETNVILSYTSMFATLTKLLSSIERTFGDPN